MNEEQQPENKSAYNLSENDIFLLGTYSKRASMNYLRGEVQETFYFTSEMRMIIDYFLNTDEAKELDELEKKIFKVHSLLSKLKYKYNESEEDEEDKLLKKKIIRLREIHLSYVQQYRKVIRKWMAKYDFLFKQKEDHTRIT